MRARAAGRFPPVNVFLDDNAVLIDMELPGKTAKDVDLTLEAQAVVVADKPAPVADGEKGTRHNPEFTMLEWYRKGATDADIADDLTALLQTLCASAPLCENASSPREMKTLTVRAAYRQFAGWDPWEAWDADRFDFDMATKIEPAIKAMGGGVFLTGYPPACASLATVADGVAARWEFYWDGLELANCFTELCDADEQRRRFAAARAERRALGEADYPQDEDFFAALPKIGSAAGVALGVDRLVMVLVGAPTIAAVRASNA